MKGDLILWFEFLEKYNGVSVFRDQRWLSNDDMELLTDAAVSIGMGITWPESGHKPNGGPISQIKHLATTSHS
jgi:hypothetical protein